MITQKYNYTPISRTTVEGKRHYTLPDGSRVPSVTSVLDKTKPEESKKALEAWRKRIGPVRAQQITSEAANRGTRMHSYLEHYVKNDDMKPLPTNPFAQPSWYMAADVILKGFSNINEFWGVEVPVYFPGVYAGTTDGAGLHLNEEAIFDYKQTNKPKSREWIDDYFLQLVAYAKAHNEVHGTNIHKGVILMSVKPPEISPGVWGDPTYQEFIVEGAEFDKYSDMWLKRLELYFKL